MDILRTTSPQDAVLATRKQGKPEALEKLFEGAFDEVAVDDYLWLGELKAAGMTHQEIAELLFDDFAGSPWIRWKAPAETELSTAQACDVNFHIQGCHRWHPWI